MNLSINRSVLLANLLLFGCKSYLQNPANSEVKAIDSIQWWQGIAPAGILAADELQVLNLGFGGYRIWKSNNPEVIRGDGWLMQNGLGAKARGGSDYPLTGCVNAYLFHINKSGTTKYIHFLGATSQSETVNVKAKGSMYTNTERPLLGKAGGQSYQVSRDWLEGTYRTKSFTQSLTKVAPVQIAFASMAHGSMVDGRFEVCADKEVALYSVLTSSGNFDDAVGLSKGPVAAGDVYRPSANAYGREAGIYENSIVAGITKVELPSFEGYMGFYFNTNNKFNPRIQDQTTLAVMGLADSAPRTYGNYGHKYDVTLRISNHNVEGRQVSLWFGSSFTGVVDSPSFTWNGPIKVNGEFKDVYTTPTNPKVELGNWMVQPNAVYDVRLTLFVPGLITTNQQLILQSSNPVR